MPFRVGIVDVTAALLVLVVIVLPAQSLTAVSAYQADRDQQHAIGLFQARLAADPGDTEAAVRLSELMLDVSQSDWAIQVPGEATRHNREQAWRAYLAVSSAHAHRREVPQAYHGAEQALQACDQASQHCTADHRTRLMTYRNQLKAGLDSGIDPRHDPQGYIDAVNRRTIMIRGFQGATPRDGDDSGSPQPPEQ